MDVGNVVVIDVYDENVFVEVEDDVDVDFPFAASLSDNSQLLQIIRNPLHGSEIKNEFFFSFDPNNRAYISVNLI